MKANERRMAILEALCERRREQVANLAFEFGVTEWTIRQDILTLSLRKITVLSNKEIEIEFECGITVRETL